MAGHSLHHDTVQLRGRDADQPFLLYSQGCGQDLVHPLAGQGGDEEHGYIVQELEVGPTRLVYSITV